MISILPRLSFDTSLCSLLPVQTLRLWPNLSPQSHLQSPAQSHLKFVLLLGNLPTGANICYMFHGVFWPGLLRFRPDRQLPTERNIYCLHFVLGLLCSSAAKCLWLCPPSLRGLCLSGSLSDLWRLQAVVVIAFLVSGWLQLKPSAVFNCHCHFGLLGLGNATFGHLQAKCLTKHNLHITRCGSAA